MKRIESIDVLRGIIMVIMALDHVRDYVGPASISPEDIANTNPLLFFTRWITHYCAPLFVFLAGTSAYLYGQRVSKMELTRFLLSRGIWLLFIELIVVHFVIMFDFNFWFVQVIWVIGWSMIILSLLIHLPRWAILVFTVVVITGHNLLDSSGDNGLWWSLLHQRNFNIPMGNTVLIVIYPLIPWPAVMAAGYLLGKYFLVSEDKRKLRLVTFGLLAVGFFFILRFTNVYGDPNPWSYSDRGDLFSFLSFLNTTKYPPSLLFLLMTIGPALIVLPQLEYWRGKVGRFFIVFGRVPFFYYILHFLIAHLLGVAYFGIFYGKWETHVIDTNFPEGYSQSLLAVYVVWLMVVIIMYPLCKWFGELRKRRTEWWLKYL